VTAGDVLEVKLTCNAGEKGNITLHTAILDEALFRQGYDVLNASTLQLTTFKNTLVEGTIDCNRNGVLYTSIPQDGNWSASVDGKSAQIVEIGDAMIGLLLDDWIDEHIVQSNFGAYIVAAMLILYGALYIIIERRKAQNAFRICSIEQFTWKDALLIGLFQCLSIIPGTSRSGSTILGGMALGVSRGAAAEFSFFMAIPIMAGVSLLKVGKYALSSFGGVAGYPCTGTEVGLLIFGAVIAFIVSLFCIRFLMDFVRRHSFEAFGWYRIILGAFVLLYFGILA
jgi:undecaprenyl-diphosphatase UppP